MKTGIIYIANNGDEFHDVKKAAMKDYELRLIELLKKMEESGLRALGSTPNFVENSLSITLLKVYFLEERENRRALKRAWRQYVKEIEKYQRDNEGGNAE